MNVHGYNVPMSAPSTVNAGTQTLIQLTSPSTRKAWITEFAVSGKDTDGTKVPPLIKFVRQTSAGTGGTSITPRPLDPDIPAALCTALERPTAEPTDGGVIVRGPWYMTSVGGLFVLQNPLGFEFGIDVSDRVGLVLITAGSINGIIANLTYNE